MKKIIGGVVVLGGVVLASYFGLGVFTERAIHKTLQDIHATKGTELTIKQYDRGFFKSSAVLDWVVHIPASSFHDQSGQEVRFSEKTEVVPIKLTICHGPIMFTRSGMHVGMGYAKGEVALPKQYQSRLQTYFQTTKKLPTLQLGLLISLLNKVHIQLAIPEFQLKTTLGHTKIEWFGLSSQTAMALNLSQVGGAVQLAGFNVNTADTQLTVGKMSSDYQFNRTNLGLYDGGAHFRLASVNLMAQKMAKFALKNVNISTYCLQTQDLFRSELNGQLEGIMMDGVNYGPGEIAISLKNLDAQVLANINQQLQRLRKESLLARQKGFLSLLPELPRLLSKGASFSVPQLHMRMPEGMIDADLTLSLPSGTLSNPFQLVSKMQGSGHVSMPVAILTNIMTHAVRQKLQQPGATMPEPNASVPAATAGEAFEQQVTELTARRLASLVQSGVLIQQGDTYTLGVTLEQGAVQVNGKAFTPAMLEF